MGDLREDGQEARCQVKRATRAMWMTEGGGGVCRGFEHATW